VFEGILDSSLRCVFTSQAGGDRQWTFFSDLPYQTVTRKVFFSFLCSCDRLAARIATGSLGVRRSRRHKGPAVRLVLFPSLPDEREGTGAHPQHRHASSMGPATAFPSALTSSLRESIIPLLQRADLWLWGRNGFDGGTGLKMRVEDHDLVKKSGINLTADQELALAA
jgi:hypothetical protein